MADHTQGFGEFLVQERARLGADEERVTAAREAQDARAALVDEFNATLRRDAALVVQAALRAGLEEDFSIDERQGGRLFGRDVPVLFGWVVRREVVDVAYHSDPMGSDYHQDSPPDYRDIVLTVLGHDGVLYRVPPEEFTVRTERDFLQARQELAAFAIAHSLEVQAE